MKTLKGFKPISEYEGLYSINKDGRIYSYPKGQSNLKGMFLNPFINKNGAGYFCVTLTKNKIQKIKKVHRLLMETFVANPKNKNGINHKDGNKLNNKLKNLEWATDRENFHHAKKNGLRDPHNRYACKISDKDVLKIRKLYKSGMVGIQIAKKFKVHKNIIYLILNNQTYKWVKVK